jgi:hypothetical protein
MLTVPDTDAELDPGAEGFEDEAAGMLDEPHPASRRPAAATTVRVRTL